MLDGTENFEKIGHTGGELNGVDFFDFRHCELKRTVQGEFLSDTLLFTFASSNALRHPV